MKRKLLLIVSVLMASFFISCTTSYADGYWVDKEIDVYTEYINTTAVFKHYIQGYWKCQDALIYDSSINYTLGYGSCTGTIDYSYTLPSAVVSALKNGEVKVYLDQAEVSSCVDFNNFSYSFNDQTSLNYQLSLCPRFAPNCTINQFVSGIHGNIPLLESPYGRNIYLVYRLGRAYSVRGFFSSSDTSLTKEGFIHPSQIMNSSGQILPSAKLNLYGTLYSGALCRIGFGDFYERGSVFLEFNCPIVLRFTTTVKEFVYTGKTDEENLSNDNSNNDESNNDNEIQKEDPVVKPSFSKRIHRVK